MRGATKNILFILIQFTEVFSECDQWSCTYPLGNGFIEYHPGDVNIVIAVPHGGFMEPESIPDRSYGTTETDSFTRDLGILVTQSIIDHLGRRPHLVISNLKRTKLDPNREIVEAAQGNYEAEEAWYAYHGYIDLAKLGWEGGLVIDLHGQSHHHNTTELGYILTAEELNQGGYDIESTSMASLGNRLGLSGEEMLIGPLSLGSFLEASGYMGVPSPRQPSPGSWPYFPGFYTVVRHSEGAWDSVSLETPSEVRIEAGRPGRVKFGEALGEAVASFYTASYAH